MAKQSLKHFYNSKEWIKLANYIRKKYCYICQECNKPNSSEVHHIKHVTDLNVTDPAVTLNENNLTLLCRECHNKIHDRFKPKASPTKQRRVYFDSEGNVIHIGEDK